MSSATLRFLTLAWIITLISPAHAQIQSNISVDSMIASLNGATNDSAKFSILTTIAQTYWATDPLKGVEYTQNALAIAEKNGWEEFKASAHGILGATYSFVNDYPKAKEHLQMSLEIARKTGNPGLIARASGSLANIAYFQSQYPEAIDLNLQSLKATESSGDKQGTAAALSNIGVIYLDLEKFDEALPYFEKAAVLNVETQSMYYLEANYMNMGIIYTKMDSTQKALEYYQKSFTIAQNLGDSSSLGTLYINLAKVYHGQGDLNIAFESTNKAMSIFSHMGDRYGQGFCYLNLANYHLDIGSGKYPDAVKTYCSGNQVNCLRYALTYADSAVFIMKQVENLSELSDAYNVKSEVQRALGDYAGALESYTAFASLRDSIFNIEEDKKLTQAAMQYDFDKKEAATMAEQEKKDIRQKNIRNSIATGLGGALIFLGVVYRQRNRISKEKKRSEELLLNILPEEVAEELKAKGSADAKMIDEVTVMFTDFSGFTQLSEKLTPKELVAEINECFSAFDHIMTKHGVEKIKTIGDAYMAVGGLPTANSTHANDVVIAALEIQQFMYDYKAKREAAGQIFFEARIGVHTGPVVAGIVGVKKFAYDIWGDTVNTANRMESSGESGKINISESTYALVKNAFTCTHRGKIEAKGKGEIHMYFVEGVA